MEHQAAVETHAVERYLLGEMPAEERDSFEEHFFACIACAEEVRVGAQFRANYDHAEPQQQAAAAAREQRWSWLRWPSMVPVAASLLFAGVVWYQAGHGPVMEAPDGYSVRETVRGAGIHLVIPKAPAPAWISFVVPADAPPPPYECTITDSFGKTVAKLTMERPVKPEARVLLHRERLEAGVYNLNLSTDAGPVAQYPFQLQ